MARLRRAPAAQTAATSKPTRQALKDRTNTAPRKPFVYEDDGDAAPLVKDARPKRDRGKQVAQNEVEYVMAGGLGLRDSDENAEAITDPPTTTDELAKSDEPPRLSGRGVRAASAAKTVAKSRKQTTALKTRAQQSVRKVAAKKSNDLADDQIVVSSSEAVPAKPAAGRKSNHSRPERSAFSLSPSPPPPGKMDSVKRSSLAQPGSALRTSGTPAVESSILALKNFKRRPRQPSMLQMVQQRTASARPSMQNTTAIAQPAQLDDDAFDLDDEDVFAPEAEGTPVLKKTKLVAVDAAPIVQSKKRKSDIADVSSSSLGALKAKRQRISKPDENQPKVKSPLRRSSSTVRRTRQLARTSDVQVINSSSSTPPIDPPSPQSPGSLKDPDEVVPSTEKDDDYAIQPGPEIDSDDNVEDDLPNGTLADPVSSSPLQSSPPKGTQSTDIMADPLTQISPAKPKLRDKQPQKKARALNTADLQALLPKRRKPLQPRLRKSEYDIEASSDVEEDGRIDISHLGEDEDELSSSARRQTRARTPAKSRKSTVAKSRKSKAASPARKSTAKRAASRKSKPAKVPSKTYGRANASDIENEEFEDVEEEDSILPDTSISGIEAAKSVELEAMRKKFAELDDWEMEFESVEVEEGRSSSQLWR